MSIAEIPSPSAALPAPLRYAARSSPVGADKVEIGLHDPPLDGTSGYRNHHWQHGYRESKLPHKLRIDLDSATSPNL